MNNENRQVQAKSHAGGNDKLGINFAWPNNSSKLHVIDIEYNERNMDCRFLNGYTFLLVLLEILSLMLVILCI